MTCINGKKESQKIMYMGYQRKSKNNMNDINTFESNFELPVGTKAKALFQFKMHSPTEAGGIQNPRPFVNISVNSVTER